MTDLGASPKWEAALWEEFEEADPIGQITLAGEWITRMTQVLLPQLAVRRRQEVLHVLADPDMDPTRLAEELGTRRTTITRLAEEGRAAMKQRRELSGHGQDQIVEPDHPLTSVDEHPPLPVE